MNNESINKGCSPDKKDKDTKLIVIKNSRNVISNGIIKRFFKVPNIILLYNKIE